MSLFRNVFNAHKVHDGEPDGTRLVDAPEADDVALDEELGSYLSEEPSGEDTEEVPVLAPRQAPESVNPPEQETRPGKYDPLNRTDIPAQPTKEQLQLARQQRARALDPELVERAARAQLDIEETQLRRQVQRYSQPADRALKDTPAPEVKQVQEPEDAGAPAPKRGRGARRVRTRMLGFDQGADVAPDPFEDRSAAPPAFAQLHPVGWMVVVQGPGAGQSFALHNGVSTIGRGRDQTIILDFGDTSISREKHAAIAYDDESNAFFLGHGGKSNIVRLNGRPVLSTEDLAHGDTVKIGETTLRFVALCCADFTWGTPGHA